MTNNDIDNIQFSSDEERRKYLADLARLKRIREEHRLERENVPQQRYNPQEGYPQPGYAPQGDYPGQGYAPQGGYSGQGYAPQGGYPGQGYAPQGGYPGQEYAPQGGYPGQEYDPRYVYPQTGYEPEYADPREGYDFAADDYADDYGDYEEDEYDRRESGQRKKSNSGAGRQQKGNDRKNNDRKGNDRKDNDRKNNDRNHKDQKNNRRINNGKNDIKRKNAEDRRFRSYEDGYDTGEDAEEDQPKKKSRWFLWVLLILLLGVAAYFLYHMFFHQTAQKGYYTVAVFGVDSRDGNVGKDALSDVNILARVNMETGEIKLVSCYRDTYVRIADDDTYHKFNEAYFRGGAERACWMIQDNLDIQVDDHATFNWKAVVDTINILGGVDVEITPAEFAYINGYITETVNSTGIGSYQLESPGMQHLDGIQAVAYARLRLMDTDYNRTERQRKIVSLAFEKAKQADFATLNCIMETILPQLDTSVTLDDMIPFAKNISHYYLGETCGWPYSRTETDVGSRGDCVVPVTLESNVIALHSFLWPEIPYTPSARVQKNSAHIAEVSGCYGDGATEIRTDNLDGSIGNTNSGSGAPAVEIPSETPAEIPSESDTEPLTEPETAAETAPPVTEAVPVEGIDGGPGVTEAPGQTIAESEVPPESRTSPEPSTAPAETAPEQPQPETPAEGPSEAAPAPGNLNIVDVAE